MLSFPVLFSIGTVFHWDITLIVLIAALCLLVFTIWLKHCISNSKDRELFSKKSAINGNSSLQRTEARLTALPRWGGRLILLAWLGFLLVIGIGYWWTTVEENTYRNDLSGFMLGMARSFASTTENLGHAKIDRNNEDSADFSNLTKLYEKWCRDLPPVSHIYTIRMRANEREKFDRIIVATEGKTQNEEKDDEKTSSDPSNQFRAIYTQAFSGLYAFDLQPHQGGVPDSEARKNHKKFITSAVPLHDANGSIEAILCVDFDVDYWNRVVGLVHSNETQLFVLLLLLYLVALGSLGLLYYSIFQIKQARIELATAIKAADVAAKAKSDFLANMSHEIRTPMNALLGFTDILTQRIEQNCTKEEREESQGILEIIRKSGRDLLTIINDILDFSRIEANLLQIDSVPLSIKQVIEDVWQMEQADVVAKNLDFAVRYKEPIPELILGDPARLRQILLNLISNAIKFTDKGSVTVKCEMIETGDDSAMQSRFGRSSVSNMGMSQTPFPTSMLLRIDIVDTGIGIESEQMEQLFKPFTQGDNSSTRQFGGTGLGLSIAKRLAQLMDGDISAESTPNIGSTFTLQIHVYLPSEKQSSVVMEKARRNGSNPPGSGIRYSSKEKRTPSLEDLNASVSESKSVIESANKEIKPLRNTRILLVEDMLVNQVVISTQLRDAGAQVETVGNGELGVQKVNQDMDDGLFFDVVLMDMQMPVMDGYEATALLRSQGYTRPIIAITAHALTGDREKTIHAGCDDYIAKPVDRLLLIEMIKKYLK